MQMLHQTSVPISHFLLSSPTCISKHWWFLAQSHAIKLELRRKLKIGTRPWGEQCSIQNKNLRKTQGSKHHKHCSQGFVLKKTHLSKKLYKRVIRDKTRIKRPPRLLSFTFQAIDLNTVVSGRDVNFQDMILSFAFSWSAVWFDFLFVLC